MSTGARDRLAALVPKRTRRTHLGCRVLEELEGVEVRRPDEPAVIRHRIVLWCPRPYIPQDRRR